MVERDLLDRVEAAKRAFGVRCTMLASVVVLETAESALREEVET